MFGRRSRSIAILLLLSLSCVYLSGCYGHEYHGHSYDYDHSHGNSHGPDHSDDDSHGHGDGHDHDVDDGYGHGHEGGHDHGDDDGHGHGLDDDNDFGHGYEDEPHPPSISPDDDENVYEDGIELPLEEDGEVLEGADAKASDKSTRTVSEDGYERVDSVVVLTDENFDAFIEKHYAVFVKFYTPWCTHCKRLAPNYVKAAVKLQKTLPLAEINCDDYKKVAERFGIKGYPTLKLFKEGKMSDNYDGDRDTNSIVKWLKLTADPNYKPPQPDVVTLTTETFDLFIADKPVVLVQFYTTKDCNKCLTLEPQYEKAAKRLKEEQNIPLVKINCDKERKLAEQYGITTYPTMKIFRNGRRFDYTGPDDSYGIVEHMTEQKKPAATHITSLKDAKNFNSVDDVTVIGFFTAETGTLYDALIDASEKTRTDFKTIGYVTDSEIRRRLNISGSTDTIVFYQPERFWSKHEPKYYRYEKRFATDEELLAFWRSKSTPLVGQKTRKNAATRYTHRPLVVVYYNVDFSQQYISGTQFWRDKLLEIANKYKNDKYKFAIADEDEFSEELVEIGLGDSGLEHNVIVFGVDGKKYPMEDDVYDSDDMVENLEQFLADISKGKVKPYVKSAPVPKGDDGPVTRVVAANFNKVVNDATKDVLIEFYAPWCGYCKKFEPKYKQFAVKHKAEQPNFVVAKFDGATNDPPADYPVQGYPTIYFSPAGEKRKPIKYEGNREISDLEEFVKRHATASFKKQLTNAVKPAEKMKTAKNNKKAEDEEL